MSRSKTMRPRWDFRESGRIFPDFFSGVEESPSSGVGISRGGDKGMESVMRPLFEKIVRGKYGGAKDFDMKVFPYSWRENN